MVGGRIQHATKFWEMMEDTHPVIARQAMEGTKWHWINPPPLTTRPHLYENKEDEGLWPTVQQMLRQGVVTEMSKDEFNSPGFYSPVFTVSKPGKTERRFICNLRRLNKFIEKKHYKMERLTDALDLIQQDDWLTSIDLTQAYHHVAVHPDYRKYLRFQIRDPEGAIHTYQYTCLPMGLSVSPRIYQKIMKTIVEKIRMRGIRCTIYMDDMLIMSKSPSEARRNTDIILQTLRDAGFLTNWDKSELTPVQTTKFLGVLINTRTLTVAIPKDKLIKCQQLLSLANQLLATSTMTARQLSKLIGTLGALKDAITEVRMYLVHLQRAKTKALKRGGWEQVVTMDQPAREELQYWSTNVEQLAMNGRRFRFSPPHATIQTDASGHGYGAVVVHGAQIDTPQHTLQMQDLWTKEESEEHNNWKELTGAARAITHFAHQFQWRDKRLLIKTDNTVTLAYLNRLGGKIPNLNRVVINLHQFCKPRGITITAEYIKGVENVIADRLSREIPTMQMEWELDQTIFKEIDRRWGPITLDLFATQANRKTSRYVSYRPERAAIATDAFTLDWNTKEEKLFVNPPHTLITRVLQKAHTDRATLILVTPVWPTAIWWPTLIAMTTSLPTLIVKMNPMTNPHAQSNHQGWLSAAWRISGSTREINQSQKRLFITLQHQTSRSPIQLPTAIGDGLPASHRKVIECSETIISSLTWRMRSWISSHTQ